MGYGSPPNNEKGKFCKRNSKKRWTEGKRENNKRKMLYSFKLDKALEQYEAGKKTYEELQQLFIQLNNDIEG